MFVRKLHALCLWENFTYNVTITFLEASALLVFWRTNCHYYSEILIAYAIVSQYYVVGKGTAQQHHCMPIFFAGARICFLVR